MQEHELPPDLADVERLYAERVRRQPASDLRRRVLAALNDTRTAERHSTSHWRWAVVLAASVLLCLNLALSLANHRTGLYEPLANVRDVDNAYGEVSWRYPEMTEQEASQFVALVLSAPALAASNSLRPSINRNPLEGEPSWDMR